MITCQLHADGTTGVSNVLSQMSWPVTRLMTWTGNQI
jgi:hypothetical protein